MHAGLELLVQALVDEAMSLDQRDGVEAVADDHHLEVRLRAPGDVVHV